jgi:hypothetical protein
MLFIDLIDKCVNFCGYAVADIWVLFLGFARAVGQPIIDRLLDADNALAAFAVFWGCHVAPFLFKMNFIFSLAIMNTICYLQNQEMRLIRFGTGGPHMTENNPRKMSPIGSAIFDMLVGMTQAQADVYLAGGNIADADRAARIAAARHKPFVIDAINRPSQK